MPELAPHHRRMLEVESGISPQIIEERGYWTATKKSELAALGFGVSQRRVPALVIPIYSTHGDEPAFHQIRPDDPREKQRPNGKIHKVKYETPGGGRLFIDVPKRVREMLADPKTQLVITEGSKKVDAALSRGIACIGLPGVWGFLGQNEHGGITTLAALNDIAWKGKYGKRSVLLTFDSDVMLKREVHKALSRLWMVLEDRGADLYAVYLPDGKEGGKNGLDDFLLQGKTFFDIQTLAEDKLRPWPKDQSDRKDNKDVDPTLRVVLDRYQEKPNGLFMLVTDKEGGTHPKQICNFTARITAIIERDNGEDPLPTQVLEVFAKNSHTWKGNLTPAEWKTMDWMSQRLGLGAVVFPGNQHERHCATYFQVQSLAEGKVESRRVYTHLGFRTIKTNERDHLVYLHPGGAIGATGALPEVRVEPDHLKGPYCLPDPLDPDDPDQLAELQDAIRTSLDFRKIAAGVQTWPLLAAIYSGPLSTLLPADFLLWVEAPTGSYKSTATALAMCHYGPGFERHGIFDTFRDTAVGLEYPMHEAKDVAYVIDDYKRGATIQETQKIEMTANSIIRNVGDLSGRRRGTKAGGSVAARRPKCLAIATGELPPPGTESNQARCYRVVWDKDAVDVGRLTTAQRHHADRYSVALSGYVRWLCEHYAEFIVGGKSDIRAKAERLREQFPAVHGRTSEAAAKLYLGVWMFLSYARDLEAIPEEHGNLLLSEATLALQSGVDATGRSQLEQKPSAIFLKAVRGLLASGQGYLEYRKGGCPEYFPRRYGWVKRITANSMEHLPNATPLGWCDCKGLVFLDSATIHTAAKLYTERQGISFPADEGSLLAALAREGMLAKTAGPGKGLAFRTSIGGDPRTVWVLSEATLWPQGEAAGPTPDEEEDGDPERSEEVSDAPSVPATLPLDPPA